VPVREVFRRFHLPSPTPPPRRRDQAVLDDAEHFVLRVGEEALAAYAWGEGEPVLLGHGWASRAAHLAAFVDPLVAAGLRAVAVEMPGHGPGPGAPSNLLQFERTLHCLGERTGPAAGVVAHSLSALATTMALGRGLRAERVVLLAPMVRLEHSVERYGSAAGLDCDGIAGFKAAMLERYGADLWERTAGDLVAQRLDVPALIVHDPADVEVPYAEAVLLAGAWPGARLQAPARVGHRLLLREQTTVDTAIAFLTDR
jgi:pimeloyl-ACP methyl ester carboxylesterase